MDSPTGDVVDGIKSGGAGVISAKAAALEAGLGLAKTVRGNSLPPLRPGEGERA